MKKKLFIILFLCVFGCLLFYSYLYNNYTTPILMYHSFDKTRIKNFVSVSPENFYRQMQFIKKGNYKVIKLSDYCQLLKENKPVPRNLVAITIDDGYKDNLAAFKTLEQLNYQATLFLVVDSIGKPGYLSRDEIASYVARGNLNIGSHTDTHPDLSKTSEAETENELSNSRARLQKMFNVNVDTLAYPGGVFNKKAMALADETGYLCVCATNRGFTKKLDRFALRRIKITDKDNNFTLWVKLSGFYNVFKKVKKPY